MSEWSKQWHNLHREPNNLSSWEKEVSQNIQGFMGSTNWAMKPHIWLNKKWWFRLLEQVNNRLTQLDISNRKLKNFSDVRSKSKSGFFSAEINPFVSFIFYCWLQPYNQSTIDLLKINHCLKCPLFQLTNFWFSPLGN